MASMTIESLVPDAEVMVFPRGPVGPGAELRLYPVDTPTHIQWRQENGAWVNLIALSTLIGPAGPTGITWRSEGWDSISEFNVRDVLFHDEKIWIATADNVNEEPGDTDAPWDVLLDGSSIATDRGIAEAARDKAQEWAEKAEDSAVEPGSYSAKHWAAKSEDQKELAVTAKTDAETARDKAEKWADEDEDVEVEPGKYSAKHWAEKAQDAAGAGASTISVTPTGGISSTNVQAALAELDTEKAPLASPALTGNPTAPTASPGDNDTTIATTAFVTNAVGTLKGTASAGYDTLGEVETILVSHANDLTSLDGRLDTIEAGGIITGGSATGFAAVDAIALTKDEYHVLYENVSHNDGTNRDLQLYYSTNGGGAWTLIGSLSSSLPSSSILTGTIVISGMKTGNLKIVGISGSGTALPRTIFGANGALSGAARAGAQVNGIRIMWATGVLFDSTSNFYFQEKS